MMVPMRNMFMVHPDPKKGDQYTLGGLKIPGHLREFYEPVKSSVTSGLLLDPPSCVEIEEELPISEIRPEWAVYPRSEAQISKGVATVLIPMPFDFAAGDRIFFDHTSLESAEEKGRKFGDNYLLHIEALYFGISRNKFMGAGQFLICEPILEPKSRYLTESGIIKKAIPGEDLSIGIVRAIGYDFTGGCMVKTGDLIIHDLKKKIPIPVPKCENPWIRLRFRNVLAIDRTISQEQILSRELGQDQLVQKLMNIDYGFN